MPTLLSAYAYPAKMARTNELFVSLRNLENISRYMMEEMTLAALVNNVSTDTFWTQNLQKRPNKCPKSVQTKI